MNAVSSGKKPRWFFRFSLGMLLVLITCLCCAFAGRIHGTREGEAATHNSFPTWTKVYFVGDLAKLNARNDFDGAMNTIKQHCTPGVWKEQGGKSQISPFPPNATVIVDTNYAVHNQIAALLRRMRKEEFGSDYRVEVTISSPASQAVADAK